MPGRSQRQVLHLHRLFWAGVDWLFPPCCGGCDRSGSRWCEVCDQSVHLLQPPYCRICSEPTNGAELCRRCRKQLPGFASLRSWAIFEGPVKNALHKLKYRRDLSLGLVFGQRLARLYRRLGWAVDLVVPVPLGKEREAERGYNQAALMARPLALECGLNYSPIALRRVRETQSQVGLTWEERQDNVRGAFLARRALVQGKRVMLVDDVATTGSTLDACAQALREAEAQQVFALTLARAL